MSWPRIFLLVRSGMNKTAAGESPHPFQLSDDAATPLTDDEKKGLIPSWITFRHELNEAEQANILEGAIRASRQRRRELLEEKFLRDLHKRMLGGVWNWTGPWRTSERNLGVRALANPHRSPRFCWSRPVSGSRNASMNTTNWRPVFTTVYLG
jgi:hypothetical protein